MGFVEIKQKMTDGGIFHIPDLLFILAREGFEEIRGGDITAKSFAFRLLDGVAEIENHDEIFAGIIVYAETLGIKPWPNVIGPRLQASTCLADFIEK